MNSDIAFGIGEGHFKTRVGGVAIHNGRVLLVTEDAVDFWYLPGGKMSIFESSDQCLQREIREEMDTECRVGRLLWVAECMFHFGSWKEGVHELSFYYQLDFPDDSPIYLSETLTGADLLDGKLQPLYFQWFKIDELNEIEVIPRFLKSGLKEIPHQPEHVIVNELVDRPRREAS